MFIRHLNILTSCTPQVQGRGREDLKLPLLFSLFLVLFLFYCAYFMLRFSIDEGARRERICAVYALFGVALIPVSFFAIRLASDFIHPTVFTREGPQMTGTMFGTFLVCWVGITLLAYVMYRIELVGKRTDANLRELREALS